MVHFIASGTHKITSHGFYLNLAYENIQNQHQIDTRFYLQENAE